MRISVAQLEQIWRIVIDELLYDERSGQLELTKDFYWDIPSEALYQMDSEPQELVVGQLSEDWNWLVSLLESEDGPIWHHFVWLSSILRAIGNREWESGSEIIGQ